MNMLSKFIKKISVISAVYSGSKFDFHLMVIGREKDEPKVIQSSESVPLPDITSKNYDTPLILIISGKGVISKDFKIESEEAGQITNHPEEFLFASENTGDNMMRVTFLRRKMYDTLCREINIERLPIVDVRIDAENNTRYEAIKAAEEFWTTQPGIKDVLTPSMRSSILLSLLAKQLLLPVLAVLLVMLLGNFFMQQHITGKLKEQQILMSQAQKNSAQAERTTDLKQQIMNDLVDEIRYPYSWIADRIASVVPDDVVLSELEIQPLNGKIQANKPVVAYENRIVVKGRCKDSESVTSLTDSIHSLGIFSTVQLNVLNKDRNNNYQFNIEISL
jgi:Tfp pilus assembly protein PilN